MKTHVNIIHWVAVFDASKPILGFVLRFHDPSIDEFQEVGSRVAVVVAETSKEFVCLSQIQDVERSPRLAGPNVKATLPLTEEREEIAQVELERNLHSNSTSSIQSTVVDRSLG